MRKTWKVISVILAATLSIVLLCFATLSILTVSISRALGEEALRAAARKMDLASMLPGDSDEIIGALMASDAATSTAQDYIVGAVLYLKGEQDTNFSMSRNQRDGFVQVLAQAGMPAELLGEGSDITRQYIEGIEQVLPAYTQLFASIAPSTRSFLAGVLSVGARVFFLAGSVLVMLMLWLVQWSPRKALIYAGAAVLAAGAIMLIASFPMGSAVGNAFTGMGVDGLLQPFVKLLMLKLRAAAGIAAGLGAVMCAGFMLWHNRAKKKESRGVPLTD